MPIAEPDFFRAHLDADVQVDFNEEADRELTASFLDFRPGVVPQLGDVLHAGCWGARPAKVQVVEVSDSVIRLRMLD